MPILVWGIARAVHGGGCLVGWPVCLRLLLLARFCDLGHMLCLHCWACVLGGSGGVWGGHLAVGHYLCWLLPAAAALLGWQSCWPWLLLLDLLLLAPLPAGPCSAAGLAAWGHSGCCHGSWACLLEEIGMPCLLILAGLHLKRHSGLPRLELVWGALACALGGAGWLTGSQCA